LVQLTYSRTMTNYFVVFWSPSDNVFSYSGFDDYGSAVGFAQEQKQLHRKEVIVLKKVGTRYQLLKFGYSRVYSIQNKVLNILAITIIAIICYLYYKYLKQ
jgi:hypothetical protein